MYKTKEVIVFLLSNKWNELYIFKYNHFFQVNQIYLIEIKEVQRKRGYKFSHLRFFNLV